MTGPCFWCQPGGNFHKVPTREDGLCDRCRAQLDDFRDWLHTPSRRKYLGPAAVLMPGLPSI
jgi:hypothetical protein